VADAKKVAPPKKPVPPKHGQIQPKEVRNPKGRGKGVPNINQLVLKLGSETAGLKDGKPISRLEHILLATFKRASEGDARARETVLERYERAVSKRKDEGNLSAEDQRIFDEMIRVSKPPKAEGDDER
jgi:hypothetical protein